jgi:hypothetical protein
MAKVADDPTDEAAAKTTVRATRKRAAGFASMARKRSWKSVAEGLPSVNSTSVGNLALQIE